MLLCQYTKNVHERSRTVPRGTVLPLFGEPPKPAMLTHDPSGNVSQAGVSSMRNAFHLWRVSMAEGEVSAEMDHVMTWTGRTVEASAWAEIGGVVDEGDLVAQARAGDPSAFEQLYERYHMPILNYLHRMVGDRTVAEDLAQDAFVKAYRALPDTRPDLAFKAWLYRIATNTAISHARRKKIVQWIPFAPSQDHATDESVEGSVTRRYDVEKTLAKLPEHYVAVLLLRHYQGLSVAETAAALDITETACKLRLFRARKAFAAAYGGPSAADPEVARAMEIRE